MISGFLPPGSPHRSRYTASMAHVVAIALLLVWIAGNFALWGLKQPQVVLFWEALGVGLPGLAAVLYYAKISAK